MIQPPDATGCPKVHKKIRTIEDLQTHLQWALSVELSTIPPYLCAQYSVIDTSQLAYSLMRSVVVEEMLHMMLVCNLMNGIGKYPSLAEEHVPKYPGFMPHHAVGGPYIQLQPLSPALLRAVFMEIEKPEASPHSPAEGDFYKTIGQFYKAIEEGFEYCVAQYGVAGVFKDTGCQRDDTYFGGGGGHLLKVTDLETAKVAIKEITEQGEGANFPQPPTPGQEPYGEYQHYGLREDGTYGPILGIPWEMSHYKKFEQLASGDMPLPATYPMKANPSSGDFTGQIEALSELFDASFTLILYTLELAFRTPSTNSNFFAISFPVMRGVLPPLATLLMQTPLHWEADPSVGPTAGPGFAYMRIPVEDMIASAKQLLAAPPNLGNTYKQVWRHTLQSVRDVLCAVQNMAQKQGVTLR